MKLRIHPTVWPYYKRPCLWCWLISPQHSGKIIVPTSLLCILKLLRTYTDHVPRNLCSWQLLSNQRLYKEAHHCTSATSPLSTQAHRHIRSMFQTRSNRQWNGHLCLLPYTIEGNKPISTAWRQLTTPAPHLTYQPQPNWATQWTLEILWLSVPQCTHYFIATSQGTSKSDESTTLPNSLSGTFLVRSNSQVICRQ